MPLMDVFNSDPFTERAMLAAVDQVVTVPNHLGSLGLFTPNPVTSEFVMVESRAGVLRLIQTSDRGAPLDSKPADKAAARPFSTVRLARSSRIKASELQFIRQFGTEMQVKLAAEEVARRLSGPNGLLAELEATWENHRLGAVQGVVLDADGTQIVDYFSEFNVTAPTEIAFDLANTANGDLLELVQSQVIRPMRRAAKGLRYSGVGAICEDGFWDGLIKNPEVRETYLNQQEASDLRRNPDRETFMFGGVAWTNYVGTDDNSTVALTADKCRFFPLGTGGAFETAWAPGETFSDLGTRGSPVYAMVIPDTKRDMYVDVEVYSYPLYIAKRPEMLFSGRAGA